jgi:hypothetical protein
MTDKITLELTLDELKLIDKYVELNDETQSVFDKIKYAYPQPKMTFAQSGEFVVVSYNDTTYYRLMGEDATCFCWYIKKGVNVGYPVPTLMMITDGETERLLEGLYYNHIVVKKETAQERGERVHKEMEETIKIHDGYGVVDYQPTPQTPEQVADGLREAFREAIKNGIIPEIKQPTDELVEKLVSKSLSKSKTLTDLIHRWWEDVFTTHSDWDMETSIEDLVDQIQLWLPKEQSAEGSQNVYVECTVEGFNDCLNKIRNKLR